MGRKSKAEERRPEILKNAYRVAEETGIQNTTLAAIARKMGVATSLITHYFKSKDQLLISLLHYMVEEYDHSLILDFQSISDPAERLDAILDSRLMEYSRLGIEDKVWYEVFGLAFRNEKVKQNLRTLYLKDLDYLISEIKDMHLPRSLKEKDIKNFSRIILLMMEGANYYFGATGDGEGTELSVGVMKKMFLNYFREVSGLSEK